jgi:pyridoxine/pyridoxamine 5'-phosphate oxidase
MSPQLQQVLTEIDRLSSTEQIQVIEYINTRQRSSVLETIANLQSQQASFKTPEEIDAEILEEKEAFKIYDLPTPYDSFGAGVILMQSLKQSS